MKNPILLSYDCLAASFLLVSCILITGCKADKTEAEPAKAAQPQVQSAVDNLSRTAEMPHKEDTATEFLGALESFSGRGSPDYRDTGNGVSIVRVEQAPVITKPGQPLTASNKPIEKDWDGTILIPDGTQMSHAHTTDVAFRRIEAHPLKDGSLRVWVRIENLTNHDLNTRVACNFKSASNEALKTAFIPTVIPAHEAIDAYFMSPMTNVVSYTILVR